MRILSTTFTIFLFILKVDNLYLHHPKSRIDISQESRLKLTTQEVGEWRQKLGTDFTFTCCLFVTHFALSIISYKTPQKIPNSFDYSLIRT